MPQKTPDAYIDSDLTALLSGKIEAFERYYAATVALSQLITEKDTAQIEKVIGLRENEIKKIGIIDQAMQKLAAGNQKSRLLKDENITELLKKLTEIAGKTMDYDNNCLFHIKTILKESSDKLMSIDRGLNAFQGYNTKQSGNAKFLNIKT